VKWNLIGCVSTPIENTQPVLIHEKPLPFVSASRTLP
jgi:hypothetical protein